MKPHYVLVDFENVQPRNLDLLKGGAFRIKVFLGSQQGKLDLDFVQAVQAFGQDAEYIRMAGSGKNALDFHLAYFLGKLAAEDPGASFSIISRDTGFDPLVRYMKAQGIDCKRSAGVTDIPHIKSPTLSPAAAPARKRGARKSAASKAAAGKADAATGAAATAPATAAPAAKAPAKGPARRARKPAAAKPPGVDPARFELVVMNLRKREKGLPKTLSALRSTVASLLVKPPAKEGESEALLAELQRRGLIAVQGSRVAYSFG